MQSSDVKSYSATSFMADKEKNIQDIMDLSFYSFIQISSKYPFPRKQTNKHRSDFLDFIMEY